MVQFRKSKKFGPTRLTASKRGVSSSVGGGPVRFGINSRGAWRSWRIPGSGIYGVKTYGARAGQTEHGEPVAGEPTRRRHPIATLIAFGVVGALLWSACSGSAKHESSSPPSDAVIAWTSGPTDGTWASGRPMQAVPFGQPSPDPSPTVFRDYTFAITEPPQLTTADGGKTVTMTSNITVKRIEAMDPSKPLSKANVWLFYPGETSELYRYDESHGTYTTVDCVQDQLAVGQTTNCTLAFTAPASEIHNSHWGINGMAMGTWPSQR